MTTAQGLTLVTGKTGRRVAERLAARGAPVQAAGAATGVWAR